MAIYDNDVNLTIAEGNIGKSVILDIALGFSALSGSLVI
jgi:hypothetical protein